MKRFKSFSVGVSDESDELDARVNAWLKENPTVTVTDSELATCTGDNVLGNTFVNITLIVWYEDGKLERL